jgi:hypothetical protein
MAGEAVMTSSVRIVRSLTIGDRTYDLFVHPCMGCGQDVYTVMRFSGMAKALFRFHDLDTDEFENFCKDIDQDLFHKAPDLVSNFYGDLSEINSEQGIKSDLSMSFRLLEYGRTRILRLYALGVESAIHDKSEDLPKESATIQAAFELGYAAGLYSAIQGSEDYYWAGVQTVHAREAGQKSARQALAAKGKRTRSALAKAAEEVRRLRPELSHNIAALAREIRKLEWSELCRSDGSSIAEDTICKYLREARRSKKKENHQEIPLSGKTSRYS